MAIKQGRIARHLTIALTIAIICFGIGLVTAIPQQDYTLYGTATLSGNVLSAQDDDVISLKVDGVELVSYTMGEIAGTDNYVLEVPMDSDSSVITAAQEGDSAYIYINGVAISEGVQVIGAQDATVQFDISAATLIGPTSAAVIDLVRSTVDYTDIVDQGRILEFVWSTPSLSNEEVRYRIGAIPSEFDVKDANVQVSSSMGTFDKAIKSSKIALKSTTTLNGDLEVKIKIPIPSSCHENTYTLELSEMVGSDSDMTSPSSIDITVQKSSAKPSTPTLNDPGTTDTDGSYTVSWSSVRSATSYTLEEDTSSSFSSSTVVHSGAGTSKYISGKSDGTYFYRVQACNAEGCSCWSNVEVITVKIPESQHDLIVTGKILWNESLVANSTHAEIVSDLEGDGNPDVLVYTLRYDPVTDIGTEKVIAKKGSDGSHLWDESVNVRGENNSYIIAHSAGDLDGDGLDDVIVIEGEYDETADTETAKVIAKIGKTGMPLWEESVSAAGEDNCDIFAIPTDDLDGDALTDVIVIESIYDRAADTTTAKVIAKKGNTGTYLWEETVNANGKDNCDIDAKSAGDLDGDGLTDIIVIESIYDRAANTTTAKVIAMIGNTGTYLWEESVNANGKDNCDIDAERAGDLDGDGFNDIIVIESKYDGATDTTTARVIAKKGNTGTHIWEESVNADGKDNCDIDAERAGDLDGDGFDDVIVSERKSNDAMFTSTMSVIAKKGIDGMHMWEESVTGMVPFIYVLPAGDLDGDGLNDVIVSEIKVDELTFTATMSVIAKKGSNGASLWDESVSGTGSHIFALPAGDLGGDGLDDVIVIESTYDKTTDTTTVRIIAKNGKTGTHMWEESVSGAGSYIAALPAGDLDGDGLNDVIATENKYDQPTDTTTTRVIAKTGKEGTHLLEAQSNELIWVATWWGHNCDLNGDGTNDLLLGISTEMYALTCLYGTNTFDTCQSANPYPSISGTHTGTITPNQDVNVSKLYTYPCAGTGGHTESVRIYGNDLDESASWDGYAEDGHTITFDSSFTLESCKTYNYVIKTGSYPQIHHTAALQTDYGWLNCTSFVDANGKEYDDWIPAIKLRRE